MLTRPPAPAPAAAPPARRLLGEATRFLVVGGIATGVDIGIFNLLHYGSGVGPLTSKVVSTVLASVVAFIGNRQWSFDGAAGVRVRRQVLAYVAVTGVALAASLVPLAVARYLLGLTSPLDLNVAGNGVGLAIGTAVRFWGYKKYVFVAPVQEDLLPEEEPARLAA